LDGGKSGVYVDYFLVVGCESKLYGKKHDQETFTYSRGKYVGEFRKGKQFNTTLYDKDGNILEDM